MDPAKKTQKSIYIYICPIHMDHADMMKTAPDSGGLKCVVFAPFVC